MLTEPAPNRRRLRLSLTLSVTAICVIATAIPFLLAAVVLVRISPFVTQNGGLKEIFTEKKELSGAESGRTNFLVMGLSPDEAQTDSMLLMSYYHRENKAVTVNIPRDMQIFDGFRHMKLASAMAYAKARNDPSPPRFLADLVSREFDVPVHYWVTVNIRGAAEIIDALGGVEVTVERPFTDYKYPNEDYSGYLDPAPHFDSGSQILSGSSALIFMRSRHSQSNEGSDFARSRRQQLIIRAALKKAKETGIIRNLLQLKKYSEIAGRNVLTNMKPNEMLAAAMIVKDLDFDSGFRIMNWNTGSDFLCEGSNSGSYVILYGTTDDCQTEFGSDVLSPYRDKARAVMQSLLEEAEKE